MFRRLYGDLKRRLAYYRALSAHPRTPRPAKWLLTAAVAYALSPIDLIPDWIPVLGYLDDLVIVPGLIAVALLLVPEQVKRQCRETVSSPQDVKGDSHR